jgi:hypothetical protein
MNNTAILLPMFILATWTGLVLLLVPFVRIRAVMRRQVVADDFKLGESTAVPAAVSIPNRNYMNLLEMPMLFYVVCLLLYAVGASPTAVLLAWSYVLLRLLHSAIHLTYNKVIHRVSIFAASNAVLVVLWAVAGYQVFVRA